jgi:hypothetical protein
MSKRPNKRQIIYQDFDAALYLSVLGAIIIMFVHEKPKDKQKRKMIVISKDKNFWVSAVSALFCMGTIGTMSVLYP